MNDSNRTVLSLKNNNIMKKENSRIAEIIKSTGIAIGAVLIGLALVMDASSTCCSKRRFRF